MPDIVKVNIEDMNQDPEETVTPERYPTLSHDLAYTMVVPDELEGKWTGGVGLSKIEKFAETFTAAIISRPDLDFQNKAQVEAAIFVGVRVAHKFIDTLNANQEDAPEGETNE